MANHGEGRTRSSSGDRESAVAPSRADAAAELGPVILFDGVCNLCSATVLFVVRRDLDATFRFAALQSDVARALLRERGMEPGTLESIVVIDGANVLTRSDAALRIAAGLSGACRFLAALRVVPRPLRDLAYRFVAGVHYPLFGTQATCMVPGPEISSRFLE